jgi:hypothetical protein
MNEIKSVVNTNDTNVGDLTNLTTTDKTSVVSAINSINSKTTPVVLYNDATGTTGDLQLNETAANFSYIEIFYQYGGTAAFTSYNNTKVYSPNNKQACLSILLAGSAGTNMQVKTAIYSISGTSMTLSNWYGEGQINNSASSSTAKNAVIKVVRVEGYR